MLDYIEDSITYLFKRPSLKIKEKTSKERKKGLCVIRTVARCIAYSLLFGKENVGFLAEGNGLMGRPNGEEGGKHNVC